MSDGSEIPFLYDSDALIQIFLAGQQEIFQILSTDFGVRSYLLNEVDTEVRSNRKFGALIKPKLDKAIKNNAIKMLSASDLDRISSETGNTVSLVDIRTLGQEYALDVGIGEAYTHAAGLLLQTPTVSNDMNAIRTLEANGKALPPTILRAFDLFGFAFAEGYVKSAEAERILKDLKAQAEVLPAPLRNASFEDGIHRIACRLSTSLSVTAGGDSWSSPFFLKRRA